MNTVQKEITQFLPALRMILSEDQPKICRLIETSELPEGIAGKLDNVLKLKSASPEEIISEVERIGAKDIPHLFSEKYGLICCGASARETKVLAENALNSSTEAVQDKTIEAKRIPQKIIIVTGAAQGFGKGIAEYLFEEGANIVIADINREAGEKLADKFNGQNTANRAIFLEANVGSPESIEKLIFETVKEFGGLDTFISNAGILRAGGLDEMDPATFDLMTKINYTGYFYGAKYASAVMKTQNKYGKDYFTDIIQINSKSGLKGSKKNFAYAGGKFGGIGLTQSFALELMPDRIKVNSICPGNFFEGPLWADPEKGLFVQYLNAGKVPGAKTIDDVKAFYEAQVPAGRGCRTTDVAKAVLYIMDQEYETGQAVPVTGGQEMLN